MKGRIQKYGLKMHEDFYEAFIVIDKGSFVQVIVNLLDNARIWDLCNYFKIIHI